MLPFSMTSSMSIVYIGESLILAMHMVSSWSIYVHLHVAGTYIMFVSKVCFTLN